MPKRAVLLFIIFATVLVLGGASYSWLIFVKQKIVIRPVPNGLSLNLDAKAEDQKISDIRSFFAREKIPIEKIEKATGSALIVFLEDNGVIYLSEENYVAELTSLQVILKRLTMDGKRFRRLDLRYERPVIVL